MPTYRITKPYTVKSKPIIFNSLMIQAILENRKTQTRRVIKIDPEYPDSTVEVESYKLVTCLKRDQLYFGCTFQKIPYRKGDFLWVRESIRRKELSQGYTGATYLADSTAVMGRGSKGSYCGRAVCDWKWKRDTLPSIFMPRWASRITLEITNVKVEKLQQISYEDIRAEGVEKELDHTSRDMKRNFIALWDSINRIKGFDWTENPWCWCISFKRIDEKEGG